MTTAPAAGGRDDHVVSWFDAAQTVGMAVSTPRRTILLIAPERPNDAGLAHPWLTSIAAWMAHSRAEDSFHGGGFHVGSDAWAVLGGKLAGKTTALGWIARQGLPIAGDDMLLVRDGLALSGPACLDLRPESAAHFGLEADTEVMRGRRRARVWLPAAPAAGRLRGFIVPDWGSRVAFSELDVSERLSALVNHAYVQEHAGRALRFFELARLPMLRWTRPQDFAAIDDAGAALLSRLSEL